MPSLPTGTVTFLFTDIEGSTTFLQRLGDRRYAEVLAEHRRLLRDAFAAGNGKEVDTQGDAFLVAFPRAKDAVATAVVAQQALMKHTWPDGLSLRVRMGLHTGEPVSNTDRYVGLDVHRASRICAAGYGGQILVSQTVKDLVALDLPAGVSLRDLGNHRLKDLKEPEHLFQVVHSDLPADFPPLKSLDARPNNLPIQLTSFVGRAREIAEVKRLLGTARLVTLTGSGGAGKTRLALQVAADVVEDYPDGVWLAEFAPIADPALVPKTVASALDVPEQLGRGMTETLVDAIRSKALLLVLDNCEHLLEVCANLAAALLRASPNVRILATSREGLDIPGETLWRVPSLSLPDMRQLPPSEDLVLYEAVRLFVDRAMATTPGFAVTSENAPVVAQVCQRLDGIPLAIELAAARVKVLAVEQIAARLDDRFHLLTGRSRTVLPRHQTLRAAIDWSYNLLPDAERVLLQRLAVFAGGWTLEAAEAVCAGGSVEAAEILNRLTSLVDKSLVLVEMLGAEARYRLLETVREYGLAQLRQSGEADDVRRRHREWCLSLEEGWRLSYFGAQSTLWLERLETEHANLRAAVEWSRVEKDGAEAGLRLVGTLWWFLVQHGHWSEAREWLEGALARSAEVPPAALPRALAGASNLAWRRGDYGEATKLAAEALEVSRKLGDKEATAILLFQLGQAAMRRGDSEQATALHNECLNVSCELGNKWWSGHALIGLGEVARYLLRDPARAIALYTEALADFRETGEIWGIAMCLSSVGAAALDLHDNGRAVASLTESIGLFRDVKDRFLAGWCLSSLARIASADGHYERAARLWGAAEALREAVEWRPSPQQQTLDAQRVASARAMHGETAFTAAWGEGRAMTLERAIEYALAPQTG